ncbi:hypothetical protein DL768_008277 [Monosporascus sp. mg162]|nr:hypothetical protein DL768_008277 [Monosporascus sp. mg162]
MYVHISHGKTKEKPKVKTLSAEIVIPIGDLAASASGSSSPSGGFPGGGNGGGPAGHRNGSIPKRRNNGGNGPGRKKKKVEKSRNPAGVLRYRACLPEDANIRAAITAFEAAADFESGDENIIAGNAALRAFRPFPERAFSAAAAAVPPAGSAVPMPAPASAGALAASVAASDPAAIALLTRVATAVEQLAANVAEVLVELRAVAARAQIWNKYTVINNNT